MMNRKERPATVKSVLRSRCSARWSAGFTLIELMVAVAVVAILAAIAYPSYLEQIRKSRRAQAKADLVEQAQLMERAHTLNNTYAGTVVGLFGQSPRAGTAQYTIQPSNQGVGTFTLTATPATASQQSDSCGKLTIDQAGRKGSGPQGTSRNPDCF